MPVTPGVIALKRLRSRRLAVRLWMVTGVSVELCAAFYFMGKTLVPRLACWWPHHGTLLVWVNLGLLVLCIVLTTRAIQWHRRALQLTEQLDVSSLLVRAERAHLLWQRSHMRLASMARAHRFLRIVQYTLMCSSAAWISVFLAYASWGVWRAGVHPSSEMFSFVEMWWYILLWGSAISVALRMIHGVMMRVRARSCHDLGVVKQELLEGAPEGALSVMNLDEGGGLSLSEREGR